MRVSIAPLPARLVCLGLLALSSLGTPRTAQAQETPAKDAQAAGAPAPAPDADAHAEVRGVTISCQTWGWEWGSDEMPGALERIRSLGGNWVAIHPYARISRDGAVRARALDPKDPPAWLTKPIAWAHERGLKILIKPHIAYWGSGFSWRGEIRFDEPEARARFYAEYRAWILDLAAACAGADAFCVGTELCQTTGVESEWRALIKDTRALLPGVPLTYAANWDRYESIAFWDALDVIGIQAYFPLVAHDKSPSDEELRAGWAAVMAKLRAYAQTHGRKILFTELGYDCTPQAARKPWEGSRSPSAAGEALQARCLEAALRAVRAEPWVVGLFLWKDFAGPTRGEDFAVLRPALRPMIRGVWTAE